MPVDIKPRFLSTAINEDDATASLDLALSVAGYFELRPEDARAVARDVGLAVKKWRHIASTHGLSKAMQDRLSSAFEHEDLRAAV